MKGAFFFCDNKLIFSRKICIFGNRTTLCDMEIWIVWLIVAAILLATEVLTQMMWALCLTAGALGAMITALCGGDLVWQVIVMSTGSLGAYLLLLPWINRRHKRMAARAARTGMDALLGRRATVTHEIRPGRLGRARIDGDNWQVQAPGIDHVIPAGREVTVTSYDSIILTVEENENKENKLK